MQRIILTLIIIIFTQFTFSRAVENIPPTVILNPLFDTNKVLGIGSVPVPTFVLEGTDQDGTVEFLKLYRGSVEILSTPASAYTYTPGLLPGRNDFYAVAIDNSQARATSAVVRVLASQAPTVQMTQPQSNVALFNLADSVVVKGVAGDEDGIAEVRLIANDIVLASDFVSPYEFVFQGTAFTTYNLQLEAVDGLGATSRTPVRQVQYVRVNDNLNGNILPLSGTNLSVKSSNFSATFEKGEPQHAGVPGGKSVWFAWRSTSNGNVIMDTFGSEFDTVLAVYTNRTLQLTVASNLTAVASNDNDAPDQPYSRVKFAVQRGVTYLIAVDGRDGLAGGIQLNIRFSQSRAADNDSFAYATRLFTSISTQGNNIGATKEAGEPDHAGNPGGASVWYRLDAPLTGQPIRITTDGSTFDTLLAVYTNTVSQPTQTQPSMENLRLVAQNDDSPYGTNRTSELVITTRSQTFVTYWIAVDGYNGAEGNIRLQVQPTTPPTPAPPSNDQFRLATRLNGTAALTFVNTTRATTEPGDPITIIAGPGARTVWYRWVAPSNAPVYMSTKFSDFDTVMGVYTGTNIVALSQVAANDDDPSGLPTSALVFNAIAGVEYSIGIGGYRGASGDLVFALNQAAFYAPRILLQQIPGRIIFSVADAQGTMLLERSSDLGDWVIVQLISPEQPVEFQTDQTLPQQFYRVRSIE
jgi:hypothetical protein